jgi:hypothetical protein
MFVAPVGQQPSPPWTAVISAWAQMALQVLADSRRSLVHELVSGQSPGTGQAAGDPARTPVSQYSPGSMVPLPQVAEQSGSVRWVASTGQQPSLGTGSVIGSWLQVAVQPEPWCLSRVQASMSSQVAGGQAPTIPLGMAMSQVSPGSMAPFPQRPPASTCSASTLASATAASAPASGQAPSQPSQTLVLVILPGVIFKRGDDAAGPHVPGGVGALHADADRAHHVAGQLDAEGDREDQRRIAGPGEVPVGGVVGVIHRRTQDVMLPSAAR